MSNVDQIIKDKLTELGIEHQCVSHPAVHTIEECKWAEVQLGCVVPKNLFLAPRNQSAFYLCILAPDAAFRTADISRQIGSSRLSFGSEQALFGLLQTYPGAVSPLGLIFKSARPLRLLVDERLKSAVRLGFHPNDNTQTLAMSGADFFSRFLPCTVHEPRFITVPKEADGEAGR